MGGDFPSLTGGSRRLRPPRPSHRPSHPSRCRPSRHLSRPGRPSHPARSARPSQPGSSSLAPSHPSDRRPPGEARRPGRGCRCRRRCRSGERRRRHSGRRRAGRHRPPRRRRRRAWWRAGPDRRRGRAAASAGAGGPGVRRGGDGRCVATERCRISCGEKEARDFRWSGLVWDAVGVAVCETAADEDAQELGAGGGRESGIQSGAGALIPDYVPCFCLPPEREIDLACSGPSF